MKGLIEQIVKFGLVGVICTAIDFGIMIFLTEIMDINYLISSGISFVTSMVINYLLSSRYVFCGKKDESKLIEFVIFSVLSVAGLGINQLLMWVCVDKAGLPYVLAKVGATAIVMLYNFITRKMVLEDKGI